MDWSQGIRMLNAHSSIAGEMLSLEDIHTS
jgi:hypothetical protein